MDPMLIVEMRMRIHGTIHGVCSGARFRAFQGVHIFGFLFGEMRFMLGDDDEFWP